MNTEVRAAIIGALVTAIISGFVSFYIYRLGRNDTSLVEVTNPDGISITVDTDNAAEVIQGLESEINELTSENENLKNTNQALNEQIQVIKVSDKGKSLGKKALKIIDRYLDGGIDADKAEKKLETLYLEKMMYVYEIDKDLDSKGDIIVVNRVISIYAYLKILNLDDVLRGRNILAEEIGEKTREK